MRVGKLRAGAGALALVCSGPAIAQASTTAPRGTVQQRLDAALAQLEGQAAQLASQQAQLDRQAAELAELRAILTQRSDPGPPGLAANAGPQSGQAGQSTVVPLERVGQAPEDADRPIELAVLDTQGSAVTRRGQLSTEFQYEYTRADRSRAVFRGVELVEAVLVGVFDINESRQDILGTSVGLRYGLTDRLEIGARLPFVYRSDSSIVAPIAGSTGNDEAATIDSSVKGRGIGDLELSARYQLLDARGGRPFLIANLQAVLPTGSDPFAIPRDELGRPRRAATGAGFYGIAPSLTAILPSDPLVLFGTLGYTFNLGKDVDTRIPPVIIDYVDPGDAVSASVGVGIAFNQRATLNFGYAHSWAFGTMTRTSLIEPTPAWPGMRETTSRDLQVGRLLMGVTYRVTNRASINWTVEVGATEDAPDVRTVLRVPIVLLAGT
jgi:hypothetical protein